MTITKGFWRTEDGRQAEVVDVRRGFAIGWVNDYTHTWNIDGTSTAMSLFNLTEPWIDKPEWDWSTTPPWLNWLAMDESVFWYLYGNKPTRTRTGFNAAGADDDIWLIPKQHEPKWSGDWKDSLISRPGINL